MGVELRILSSWSRRPIGARGFPPVEQRLWESLELWHSLEFIFFFSFSHKIFEFHKFSRQSCRRKLKYFLAILQGPWWKRCFIFFFKQIKAEKFLLIQNRIRTNPAWLPATSALINRHLQIPKSFRVKMIFHSFFSFTSAEGQTNSAQNKKTLISPTNWQEEKWLFVSLLPVVLK